MRLPVLLLWFKQENFKVYWKLCKKTKTKLKSQLVPNEIYKFRKINDEKGECATLLTIIFNTKEIAENFAKEIGGKPIAYSGWHVYNNMEQILEHENIEKNSLPQTDDILARSVNISVGVVDSGLGSGFGINILSSDEEIDEVAKKLNNVIQKL